MNKFEIGSTATLILDDYHWDEHPLTGVVTSKTRVNFSKGEEVRVLDHVYNNAVGWVRVCNSLQEIAWLVEKNLKPKEKEPPALKWSFLKDRDYAPAPRYFIHSFNKNNI